MRVPGRTAAAILMAIPLMALGACVDVSNPPPDPSAGAASGHEAESRVVQDYLYRGGFRMLDVTELDRPEVRLVRGRPYAMHETRCCWSKDATLAFSRVIVGLKAMDPIFLYYDSGSNYLLVGDADAFRKAKGLARADGAAHSTRRILSDVD